MEKDKGKNRSDLLKAGSKKSSTKTKEGLFSSVFISPKLRLQQYWQKKESKGSSQGQASNRPSNSDQHGAETDADSASTVKQTVVQLAPAEEANSTHQLSMPVSAENLSASDTDISTAGPFSLPVSPGRIKGETRAGSNDELPPYNSETLAPCVDSSIPNEGIGTHSPDASNKHSVMMVSLSKASEIPVIGWKSLDPDVLVPADSTIPPFSFNEAVATAEGV